MYITIVRGAIGQDVMLGQRGFFQMRDDGLLFQDLNLPVRGGLVPTLCRRCY